MMVYDWTLSSLAETEKFRDRRGMFMSSTLNDSPTFLFRNIFAAAIAVQALFCLQEISESCSYSIILADLHVLSVNPLC
jgi:hypothetical protein